MAEHPRVVIVTGLSGSGKSTALHVLEDLGFYCIDNMPVVLVPKFLELSESLGGNIQRVAFGIDLRERAFFGELPAVIDQARRQGQHIEVLFLDAADDVLVRRFSETRRPHPLAAGGPPIDGIRRERERLSAVRAAADRILDSTALTVHQLRAELTRDYAERSTRDGMSMFLTSFGYKFGTPADADMVLDVRFLPNPFFVEELRPLCGLDEPVSRYVLERPESTEFLGLVQRLLQFLLPRYLQEGKTYFTVALGCTGGRHRSVVLAEEVGRRLSVAGYRVQVRHRDIAR
ncbi:MAG: RNase adapter RapZ [Deltaproteobacteria bacterium]|nr:RNase adapter RapZ [Deltaproteobacteria bacterium]